MYTRTFQKPIQMLSTGLAFLGLVAAAGCEPSEMNGTTAAPDMAVADPLKGAYFGVQCLLAKCDQFKLFTKQHDGAAPLVQPGVEQGGWVAFPEITRTECPTRGIYELGIQVTDKSGTVDQEEGAELWVGPNGPGDGYIALRFSGAKPTDKPTDVYQIPIMTHKNGNRNYLLRPGMFTGCAAK